jgi:triphosphoribosyl-dephospho-CoA synthase
MTPAAHTIAPTVALASACFLHACWLDVAVRKPGNVSRASPGHGMQAQQFIDSARVAAAPLFEPGARVGVRIEAAMAATWAAAGCNTNLGILLLCAPVAAAVERDGALLSTAALRAALEAVLADLDLDDARAAYRAIALANPGGLGRAGAEDVHATPSLGLRAAMALAAGRDSIARQYACGFAELFETAQPLLAQGIRITPGAEYGEPDALTVAAVQRTYLAFLSRMPDSHIVRKHGEAVAHNVMNAAQAWRHAPDPGADPAFAAWDDSLKAQRINPGTSADLTVAALLLAGVLAPVTGVWHGS